MNKCFSKHECEPLLFSEYSSKLLSYPVWGPAVFPRSDMCAFWPAAGFWAYLGPGRRGGGLSGSPAACSLEESSATTGQTRQARTSYYIIFTKKIEVWLSLSSVSQLDSCSRKPIPTHTPAACIQCTHGQTSHCHRPAHIQHIPALTQRHKPWQMGPWFPLVSRHLPSFASSCSFLDCRSRPLSASYH